MLHFALLLSQAVPTTATLEKFAKGVQQATSQETAALTEAIRNFVESVPAKLADKADGLIATFHSSSGPASQLEKVETFLRQHDKATSSIEVHTIVILLSDNALPATDKLVGIVDALKAIPDALAGDALESVGAFVRSLNEKVPTLGLLESLARGVRRQSNHGLLQSYIAGLGTAGVPTEKSLTTLLESFESLPPTSDMVTQFVNGVADLSVAKNDVWRTVSATSGHLKERSLQGAYAASLQQSLFHQQQQPASGTRPGAQSTCHTRAALSMKRFNDAQRRFDLQTKQYLQQQLLELVHKQHRQLEYRWLELFPFALDGLETKHFKTLQAKLSKFNLDNTAKDAGHGKHEDHVKFTVTRDQYPSQFALLGAKSTSKVSKPGSEGGTVVFSFPSAVTFTIDAPQRTAWHSMYFTTVEVFMLPFKPKSDAGIDRQVEFYLFKESPSTFFTSNGAKSAVVAFQHTPRSQRFAYLTDTCQQLGKQLIDDALIQHSPYGRWSIEVQTQNMGPEALEALQHVQQLQFHFTVHHSYVSPTPGNVPLFAGDAFSPNRIPMVLAPKEAELGECPVLMTPPSTTTTTSLFTTTVPGPAANTTASAASANSSAVTQQPNSTMRSSEERSPDKSSEVDDAHSSSSAWVVGLIVAVVFLAAIGGLSYFQNRTPDKLSVETAAPFSYRNPLQDIEGGNGGLSKERQSEQDPANGSSANRWTQQYLAGSDQPPLPRTTATAAAIPSTSTTAETTGTEPASVYGRPRLSTPAAEVSTPVQAGVDTRPAAKGHTYINDQQPERPAAKIHVYINEQPRTSSDSYMGDPG